MFVQVKAGGDARTNAKWQTEIESTVEAALDRFTDRLSGVEVFISDENGREKSGSDDKCCVIEARIRGLEPVAVRTHAATFDAAVEECAEKMERTLEHRFGRLEDKAGQTSQSGDELLGPIRGPLPDVGREGRAK